MRGLWVFLFVFLVSPAWGQGSSVNLQCLTGSSPPWGNCSASNPLPVTAVSSTAQGATHTQTAALAANLVVKASAGNLYSFQVSADSTLSAAAWWIMIYDATAAPSDGGVTPAKCYALPSGATSASFGFGDPVVFTTGIVIGVSTNGCFTKAASAHAFVAADYK